MTVSLAKRWHRRQYRHCCHPNCIYLIFQVVFCVFLQKTFIWYKIANLIWKGSLTRKRRREAGKGKLEGKGRRGARRRGARKWAGRPETALVLFVVFVNIMIATVKTLLWRWKQQKQNELDKNSLRFTDRSWGGKACPRTPGPYLRWDLVRCRAIFRFEKRSCRARCTQGQIKWQSQSSLARKTI